MNYKDNRKFVGGEDLDPLLPVFKGNRAKIYPGQLAANKGGLNGSGLIRRCPTLNSCLRRYIFRYENNTFVYLATRKGQRNGGFNIKNTQQYGVFNISAPGASPSAVNQSYNFSYAGKNNSNEDVYGIDANSRIRYDSTNTRWVWETRPATTPPAPPSGPFYVTAFTDTTSNPLTQSSTTDQITWTYVSFPFGAATPQVPATVSISLRSWYNNNDVVNLNKWPITNKNVELGAFYGRTYKWQSRPEGSGAPTPEGRISCLSDELLFKCFQGIPLKPYEIVFVEIQWTFFAHKVSTPRRGGDGGYVPSTGSWGYNISNEEWWSPTPFNTFRQKGRIYRIGKLDADNGVGQTDTVLFAQRTRIVTTKYSKGGYTALE